MYMVREARSANRTAQGGGGRFWSIFDSTRERPFAIDGLSYTTLKKYFQNEKRQKYKNTKTTKKIAICLQKRPF